LWLTHCAGVRSLRDPLRTSSGSTARFPRVYPSGAAPRSSASPAPPLPEPGTCLEVLELRRIPDTTDILAIYEVTLDGNGDMIRCERGQRYHRGHVEEEL
jgi:Gas vesicle synthesis protein GvpO